MNHFSEFIFDDQFPALISEAGLALEVIDEFVGVEQSGPAVAKNYARLVVDLPFWSLHNKEELLHGPRTPDLLPMHRAAHVPGPAGESSGI